MRFTKNIRNKQDYCEFELKKCRYQDIYGFEKYKEIEEYADCDLTLAIDKLGQLENIEESMGVDLIAFLSELLFVLSNCNGTVGYTTDRKPIVADYGYVEDFINRLKEAINREKRIRGELQ